jgi:tRNA-binding protein
MSKSKLVPMITITDFIKLDIRVGQVVDARINKKAIKPSLILQIDFGQLGIKGSSAQLCDNYQFADVVGRQILAVVNLPPRRVGGFESEVLVLAVISEGKGTVLVGPDQTVELGSKLA